MVRNGRRQRHIFLCSITAQLVIYLLKNLKRGVTFIVKFLVMKKTLLLISFLSFAFILLAQKDYKVVFDLTSKDTTDHKNVIRWLNEIAASEPSAQLEVVLYGKSLDMVVKDRSVVADAVQKLATQKNIAFKVCQVAMKNNNIDKGQLLPGVQTVPDGIYEIITKQRQGWGYIKASK